MRFLCRLLERICEIWKKTKHDEEKLEVWEKKVLRKIIVGMKADVNKWRRRTNKEFNELHVKSKIAYIKKSMAWKRRWRTKEREPKENVTAGGDKGRGGVLMADWIKDKRTFFCFLFTLLDVYKYI